MSILVSPFFRQTVMLTAILLLCWPTSGANKSGCAFHQLRPIPEGKAVIYFFTSLVEVSSPIIVNGENVVGMHRGGYYPFIASPGKQEISTGGMETNPMPPAPGIVINAEPGREYYVEFARGLAPHRLREVPEKKALEKLRDDRLLIPAKRYTREFASGEELSADPVYIHILRRNPSRWYRITGGESGDSLITVFDSRKLSMLLPRSRLNPFDGGSYMLFARAEPIPIVKKTRIKGPFVLVVEQHGVAKSCSDPGFLSEAAAAK